MKKKILILALSACAALLFSSCDNEKKPEKKTDVPVSTDTPISSTADTPKTTTSNIPSLTTTVTPISTVPAKDMVTVNIYEGSGKDDRVLIESQSVEKNKTLLDQLKAPNKPGFKFLRFHFASSYNDVYLEADYVIKKNLDIYASFDSIDINSYHEASPKESTNTDYFYLAEGSNEQITNFYQNGYIKDNIIDFSIYKNTDSYVTVKTADEFINALQSTKCDYETTWTYDELTSEQEEKVTEYEALMKKRAELGDAGLTKEEKTRRVDLENEIMMYTGSIKQTLKADSKVHVIEITEDLNLGYNKLSTEAKALVTDWASTSKTNFTKSSHFEENGVSLINISNAHNLLIYSKNGAKITNAGFKVNSCNGFVIRNLVMDEIWQWEDTSTYQPGFTVGDMDVFGWAYFKVNSSTNVWFDHMTFGKSYDGQIDVSNPYWYNMRTYKTAPYGVDENDQKSAVTISNCKFLSGSDDKDGYLYKMMEEIEADYQKSEADSSYECKYLYYKTLRKTYNLSFEEILYGVAIPQKKAFLIGDSSESKKIESYRYNLNIRLTLLNNVFVDIEDRIPNVRGGVAYMANCLIDNSRYYKYRKAIIASGAQGISNLYPYTNNNKTVYPFKLALVSQAIVGGYGASICAENCIFIGVDKIVKNNNSEKDTISADQMRAGYKIINCIWYNDKDDTENKTRIINTDTDPNQIQSTVGQTSPMTVADFNWHNDTNTKPFEIKTYELSDLTNRLCVITPVGSNKNFGKMYLYTDPLYYTEKDN